MRSRTERTAGSRHPRAGGPMARSFASCGSWIAIWRTPPRSTPAARPYVGSDRRGGRGGETLPGVQDRLAEGGDADEEDVGKDQAVERHRQLELPGRGVEL